jgi:hypothetical protein
MTNATFIGEKSKALFNEDIDTSSAKPRIGGEFLKKIFETAVGIGKNVVSAPKSAGVYSHARTVQGNAEFTYGINPGAVPLYRAVANGDYPVTDADQWFLRRITGKNDFVYGANDDGKLYADGSLRKRNENQYSATAFHEVTHTVHPDEENEGVIEGTAKNYANYLRNDYDAVVSAFAQKAYKGFVEAEVAAGKQLNGFSLN